jgi:hypothetical protein
MKKIIFAMALTPVLANAQPLHELQPNRPMHICPAGQSWQDGCAAWGPKMQGQLFGPCTKTAWSCKRAAGQIQ